MAELLEFVLERYMENSRITIRELSSHFPQISRSLLPKIVKEYLLFRKLCARWVPKQPRNQAAVNALASQWISLQEKVQADFVGAESRVRRGILNSGAIWIKAKAWIKNWIRN